MSTNWKRIYGPIVAPDSSAHVIVTVNTGLVLVITKFSISNITTSAATATIAVTPSGGSLVQVYQKVIPQYPVQGGIMEVAELEGAELNAGDTITFTDATGSALAPWISGVYYTP